MNKFRLLILFGLISNSAFPNFQDYTTFNQTIKRLEYLGYDDQVLKQHYIKLLSVLNEAFELNLTVEIKKNRILVTDEDFRAKFKSIVSLKANSVLSHIRPKIEDNLSYYNLPVGFEEYITDMMMSIADSESRFYYSLEYDTEQSICINKLTFRRDSSHEYLTINSLNPQDADEFFQWGDTIVSINAIPIFMIPNGLFDLLLEDREKTIEIRRNDKIIKRKLRCSNAEKKRYFSIDTTNSEYLSIKVNQLDHNFTEKLLDSLAFYSDTTRKLILDFTDCGGGLLKEAINFADCFIDTKELILKLAPRIENAFDDFEYFSTPGATINREVHTILTSQNTASGAEVIIAVLRHYNLVKNVIGEKTLGHGIVQQFFRYPSNNNIGCKFTVGYMIMPDGKPIHNNGIVPNIQNINE